MNNLAEFAIRRRRAVLIAAFLFVVVATTLGVSVFGKLTNGGFIPDNAQSARAEQALHDEFGITDDDLVVLVDAKGKSVDDAVVAQLGMATTRTVETNALVKTVSSYWAMPIPQLKSADGTKAIITVKLKEPDSDAGKLIDQISIDDATAHVTVGGVNAVTDDISTQVSADLSRAESIALPLVLLLLIAAFGGLVAALLPIAIGALAIVGTFLILSGFTTFTDVSVFSINLVTMMGLGLGIDYSLFIISRYREELERHADLHVAIVNTVQTAGRTVLFSGVAIAVALSSLLAFPLYFLRSFAYAGVSVVILAAVASVVVLPAALAALGPNIDRFRIIRGGRQLSHPSLFWARVARTVIRRPIVASVVVLVLMLAAASPLLAVRWGATDERVLPTSAPSRQVTETLRADFDGASTSSLQTILVGGARSQQATADFARAVSEIRNVGRVDFAGGSYVDGRLQQSRYQGPPLITANDTALEIVLDVSGATTAGTNVARQVREMRAPFPTLTAGEASTQVDTDTSVRSRLVPASLILAGASFVILFLLTGSFVLPIKAILMATVSMGFALGVIVWIFQEGHLANVFDFSVTGTVDYTNLLVMFCIAFGLSMDYEVFVLSRIKEAYDASGNIQTAIEQGLSRTGRLVSLAAAAISIVFLAFATSQITFIKLIGLGLAVAVIVDATLVRGILLPSLMRLLGEANWWAPRSMKRLHARVGFSESDVPKQP